MSTLTVIAPTQVRSRVWLRNEDGDLTDPAQLFCYVKHPDGTTVDTYEYLVDVDLVRESQGVYSLAWLADTDGTWRVRWQAPLQVTGDDFLTATDGSF